jgi:uncharacterized protein (DUF169 family)
MSLKESLGLSLHPIAIAFLQSPPSGVSKWEGGAVPAGCTFWRYAQDGKTFYTEASDHYNCAVGAYTHKIDLPSERSSELEQTVGFMVENSYIQMSEVPGIPTLPSTPSVIAYGPAETAPFPADVVILSATPAQAMLIYEAAARAGAESALQTIGRPACAVLPLAIKTGGTGISLGCKGNRTFTGLPDDSLYIAIPGSKWENVLAQMEPITSANSRMATHYSQHKAQFPLA